MLFTFCGANKYIYAPSVYIKPPPDTDARSRNRALAHLAAKEEGEAPTSNRAIGPTKQIGAGSVSQTKLAELYKLKEGIEKLNQGQSLL